MRRIKQQAGFTIVEMLVAMLVLGVVAVGAMTFMQVVMRQGRAVLDRTDSAQHGRLALDQMTRQIRSQVCLNETTKGLISATPTALTFYTDLSNGGAGAPAPAKRSLEYDSASRRIVQRIYAANGTTVLSTRVLLEDVVPAANENVPATPPTLPFFSYFAYPDPMPASPVANQPLTGALSPASVGRVAVVEINFAVLPTGAKPTSKITTPLRDGVVLRNADPNATKGDPTCS